MSVLDELAEAAIDREISGQMPAPMLRAFINAASKLLVKIAGPTLTIGVHSENIRRIHTSQASLGAAGSKGRR